MFCLAIERLQVDLIARSTGSTLFEEHSVLLVLSYVFDAELAPWYLVQVAEVEGVR
jgi:hypothetical protein